jgi:hypothetical protein
MNPDETSKITEKINKGVQILSTIPVAYQLNSKVQTALTATDKDPIKSITVYRVPLQTYVDAGLAGLSSGAWDAAMKKHGYDQIFHLYMIVTLASGAEYIVEKNEIVNVAIALPEKVNITDPNYRMDVPFDASKRRLTIRQMLNNCLIIEGKDLFYTYDFKTNNCQVFVRDCLKGSGLLTPELEKFIIQPIADIAKEVGVEKLGLPSALPNIAGAVTSRL